jgi:ribonuclease HI
LYAEAAAPEGGRPRWKFVLQPVGGDDRLSASDTESESRSSRLELLAVVRGLEALDQPSRVTLLTRSRYVSRGLKRQLPQWRERRWHWERFGKLVPIRDHDLWRRIDRALEFHKVECCPWLGDEPHADGKFLASAMPWQPVSQEPALVVVERRSARRLRLRSLTQTLRRLRQGVLTPFTAICRPAFTRAARLHTIACA